ncbi:MAG TPA: DUF4166 domain-containing protein [Xanthobacteraceae bacterium]|nr:DUF4166 domain-containing protein [Xanthobacteraceae bacterium]
MQPPVVADQARDCVASVAGRGHAELCDQGLGDLRFRALLSAPDWDALSPAVRRRFSRRLAGGMTAVYVGRVTETRMSGAGWCLAQAARLIGAPLPLGRDHDVAAVVAVTEDRSGGGQNWTRLYARRAGFPQIIHSAKRFAGPTGLEEYVGYGVGMALTVHVAPGALVFRSAGYFVQLFGRRLAWPAWLSPGRLTVTHGACDDGAFTFTLDLVHPRVGGLIRQTATFREAAP